MHNGMIEAAQTRQVGVDVVAKAGVEESNVRRKPRCAQHRNQQRGFVLTIAIATLEHLRRRVGQDGSLPKFDTRVANRVVEPGRKPRCHRRRCAFQVHIFKQACEVGPLYAFVDDSLISRRYRLPGLAC